MFTEKDIGMWVTYKDGLGNNEAGKLKSYNNETRTAFVVYKCNGNRDLDHRKDYTAQATSYDDLDITDKTKKLYKMSVFRAVEKHNDRKCSRCKKRQSCDQMAMKHYIENIKICPDCYWDL